MWPWLWYQFPTFTFPWRSDINFPLSGSVMQDIHPNWFTEHITQEDAGEAKVEERIFEIASYGKQLGIITDILLNIIDPEKGLSAGEAKKAIKQLQEIHAKVEKIKDVYGKKKTKSGTRQNPQE